MIKKMIFLVLATLGLATACSTGDDGVSTSRLTIDIDGLENLGSEFVYEGWIIVSGEPISTGVFTVDDNGDLSQTSFPMNMGLLQRATTFVLSIEPAVDLDPAPAATKILVGDFNGKTASVSSNGIVGDFSTSTGAYILATPTDLDNTNEESGVWFLDNSGGSAVAGLDLPTLSDGWKYEGWAVISGMPVSTGTFLDPGAADDNAASSVFKGDANNGPNYPGEDFLQNAPNGLAFPTDLKGTTIVISVEPDPDNNPAPFTLKPLVHIVPADAMSHTTINMGTGPVLSITGSVSK